MDKVETFKLIKSYCPICGAITTGSGFDISTACNNYLKLNIRCEKCGRLSVVRTKKVD